MNSVYITKSSSVYIYIMNSCYHIRLAIYDHGSANLLVKLQCTNKLPMVRLSSHCANVSANVSNKGVSNHWIGIRTGME